MSNINLVSFLDAAQRTIIGEQLDDNGVEITIKNPVVVNIVPQYDERGAPTGQMALQLLPVYFREFQGEKKNPAIFKYPKALTTQISFEGGFDFRLYGQYEHIFNPQVAEKASPAIASNPETAPVLKLFEV
jgi:hypothetical protein